MSILAELESLSPYEPIDAEPANDGPLIPEVMPRNRRRGRPVGSGQQWFEDWRCPCPECCARFPDRAQRAAERSARAAKAAKKARKSPRFDKGQQDG